MIEDLKTRIELLTKSLEMSMQNYTHLTNEVDKAKANHNALIGRIEEAKTLLEMATQKLSANEELEVDGKDCA